MITRHHPHCTPLNVEGRYVSDASKLRLRSKFLIGTCAVHIVFLESASNAWTDARRKTTRGKITSGFSILTGCTRMSNPAQTLGAVSFHTSTAEETTSRSAWDPLDSAPNNDLLQRNIRQFLRDKGFYRGVVDKTVAGWRDDELRQALWAFNNDQRERLNTDWAILVAVLPTPNHPTDPRDAGWASEELGMEVVSELPGDLDWVVAHETGHLFGPLDEYKGGPVNHRGGMYKVPNTNVDPATGSVGCLMRDRGARKVCDVSWNQFGLQQTASGGWIAVADSSFQQYEMYDNHFRYDGGVTYVGGVIRRGGELTIAVSGSSKMHPWYNPHGPDGDRNTIVGSDHLLAGQPFSCVVGRWLSLDGSQTTPWFHVGSSSRHRAPFAAYFVWNVNDKRDNFGDNSGRMTVKLTAKLRDQLGAPWVHALPRSSSIAEMTPAISGMTSTDQ